MQESYNETGRLLETYIINNMTNEEKGIKAWALHNAITNNEKLRRELFLENMKNINELYSDKLYRVVLGDEDAPWKAYLGQHEVFYTASKVYTMNKIYQKFVKELCIELSVIVEIPTTKLSNLLTVVTKENVMEWLTKASVLTTQDFQDELRKSQGKISYLDCKHETAELYTICNKCGFRHKGQHEIDDTQTSVK